VAPSTYSPSARDKRKEGGKEGKEGKKEEKEEDGVYQCVSPFSLRPNAPRLRTRTSS
jgi:hypothetical protein